MTDDTTALIAEARQVAAHYARDLRAESQLIDRLAAALSRAQADAARMRSALEPFAVEYDRQAEYWPDKARVKAWAPFATAYRITIDDLRAARAALEPRHD